MGKGIDTGILGLWRDYINEFGEKCWRGRFGFDFGGFCVLQLEEFKFFFVVL